MKRYFDIETLRPNGNFERWMEPIEGVEAAEDQIRRMKEFAQERGISIEGQVRAREMSEAEVKHHLINTKRGWFDSYLMRKSVENLEAIVANELAAGDVIRVREEEDRKLKLGEKS